LGDFNREATLRCVDIFTETIWIEAGILLGIDLQSSWNSSTVSARRCTLGRHCNSSSTSRSSALTVRR